MVSEGSPASSPLGVLSALFFIPQSAIQAAANASVEVKNVLEFFKQWKEMG